MTPAAKIVYLSAVLIGLSIGSILGFQQRWTTLRTLDDVNRTMAPQALDDFAYAQFKYADEEHARAALATVIGLLKTLEAFRPDSTQKTMLATAYTRLALLDDGEKNSDQSHLDMEEAQRWYAASGGQAHSESEMKTSLATYDNRMPRNLIPFR